MTKFIRKILKIVPMAVLAVGMVGCALGVGVRESYIRDGKQVYESKCNGLGRTIGDCHAQASKQCNGKYEEVSRDGTSSFVPYNGTLLPVNNRSLAFHCKE